MSDSRRVDAGQSRRNGLLAVVAKSPEMEVLAICARLELSESEVSEISKLLSSGIDIKLLGDLAARHRLTSFLERFCRQHPTMVPTEFEVSLRNRVRLLGIRNLGMVAELIRIVDLLAENSIPAVPYKGPVLTEQLYGTVAMRPMQDLDILIMREDLPRIEALLTDMGYESSHTLSGFGKWYKDRTAHHAAWRRRRDDMLVELHWGVARDTMAFQPDVPGLIARAGEIEWRGRTVRQIDPEEMFIFLCVHGTGHRWAALEWLMMVAELCRQMPSLDWGRLRAYAQATGVRRELHLSVILLVEILDAQVPDELFDEACDDRAATRLARQCTSDFTSARSTIGQLRKFLFMVALKARLRDKIRCVLVEGLEILIFPLIYPDRSLSPLVACLSLMTRPFRLFGRLVRSRK
jgi:hypothetical protein